MKLIVAVDQDMGIGYEDRMAWHDEKELNLFASITRGKTLVMGRKTVENLPKLPGRTIICLTRSSPDQIKTKNKTTFLNGLPAKDPDTFIAGGVEIYRQALQTPNYIDEVYLSIMKESHPCDTFFDRDWLQNFVIQEEKDYETFTHYRLVRTEHGETQYLQLLRNITKNGGFRNGRNGVTVSTFNNQMTFDLRKGFPLLTTKKMFMSGIIEEFLFFLRGDTDSSDLMKKNVKIWERNTAKEFLQQRGLPYAEGVMGPMYGYQWRNFGASYDIDENGRPLPPVGGIDQLADVVRLIREDPHSRRILMTVYNPAQAEEGVLYPCHSIVIQFYVDSKELDMFCYNRSQDVFLGVPFNIASSSLLLIVVAKLTGKTPRFFHLTMGDTHIYTDHCDAVEKQIHRIPYAFPQMTIPDITSIDDLDELEAKDFVLSGYVSHGPIKAPMIA